MKKTEETLLHCSLCGAGHHGKDVQPGWFAEFKTDKMVGIKHLICPNCLDRLGIKRN